MPIAPYIIILWRYVTASMPIECFIVFTFDDDFGQTNGAVSVA